MIEVCICKVWAGLNISNFGYGDTDAEKNANLLKINWDVSKLYLQGLISCQQYSEF